METATKPMKKAKKAQAPTVQVKPARPYIVFNKPSITQLEIDAVSTVLESGWLSSGAVVKNFEQAFEKFIGYGYAVATTSCTHALLMALKVLSVGDGAEVITSPLTFAATANAILLAGAKPVFVDVDPSGNLDPEKIRFSVGSKTRAVIPIHLYGNACDMPRIMAAAQSFELKVVDDCAHAFGGAYVGRDTEKKIGTMADISCFSFYPNKNITSGEGGMCITKRAEWAERIRAISYQGINKSSWARYGSDEPSTYESLHEGIKGNLSDVHAAIGLVQIKRWPEIREARSKVWAVYEQVFGPKERGHSQNIFTVRVKNRDAFRRKLHAEGIGTGIHYNPLHLEAGFKFLGYQPGNFPEAERIGRETVSLPVSATMTEEDAVYVAETATRYMEVI